MADDDEVIIACTSLILASCVAASTILLANNNKRRHKTWLRKYIRKRLQLRHSTRCYRNYLMNWSCMKRLFVFCRFLSVPLLYHSIGQIIRLPVSSLSVCFLSVSILIRFWQNLAQTFGAWKKERVRWGSKSNKGFPIFPHFYHKLPPT